MTSMEKLLHPDRPTPDVDRPARFVQHQRYAEERVPLAENEYEVLDSTGRVGIVRLRLPAIDLHWLNHSRQSTSLTELTEQARRNALPSWVSQVPVLAQKIETVFQAERERGLDPHIKVGVIGGEVYRWDLKRGVRHSREIRELRADLARGKQLPAIYDTPEVRAALGLEAA